MCTFIIHMLSLAVRALDGARRQDVDVGLDTADADQTVVEGFDDEVGSCTAPNNPAPS